MKLQYGGGVMVAILAIGCAKHEHVQDLPGECLALPGAARAMLTADPEGHGLYWFEPVRTFDYDSDYASYDKLVHYDLRERRLDVIEDHVRRPLLFTRDGLVVRYVTGKGGATLLLLRRDGFVQDLIPGAEDVLDAEQVDPHTIVYLAYGYGTRAVYLLDLDKPHPERLLEADALDSVAGGHVFARTEAGGVSFDLRTRARADAAVDKAWVPDAGSSYYVADSKIHHHVLATGADTVVGSAAPWKLLYQTGSILARTPPADDVSKALLLHDGQVTWLPDVRGGASILGVTKLAGDRWALIGHNTSNYIGDLGETNAETDVCLLPATGSVTFKTRQFPGRYQVHAQLLFAAVQRIAPKATIQILDTGGDPTTLLVEVPEAGGADFAKMRTRAREVALQVTSILGDREVRTEVEFSDKRHAFVRWKRERLGDRETAGMGDAMIMAPDDSTIRLRGLVDKKDGAHVRCAGTLINPRHVAIKNVVVRCISDDRTKVIAIPELPPDGETAFDQVFDAEDGDPPGFALTAGDQEVETFDLDYQDRRAKLFAAVADAYDATKLAYESFDAGDGRIELLAPAGFEHESQDRQHAAATAWYERLEQLRPLLEIDKDTDVTLRIRVARTETSYLYDGKKFSLED